MRKTDHVNCNTFKVTAHAATMLYLGPSLPSKQFIFLPTYICIKLKDNSVFQAKPDKYRRTNLCDDFCLSDSEYILVHSTSLTVELVKCMYITTEELYHDENNIKQKMYYCLWIYS
jgi:hypothetical protein